MEIEELKKITSTGENGRIRKVDILRYLKKDEKPTQQVSAGVLEEKLNLNIQAENQVENLPRIREVAAKHLQSSYQIIPNVTTYIEVNVTDLVNHRNKIGRAS